MSGRHRAELVLEGEEVESIHRCIAPEFDEMEGRSTVDVDLSDSRMVLEVSAPDLVSLRAGVNTWSRFAELVEDVLEDGGQEIDGSR